eukprot:2931199-Pleurochrysis_carterae.AAC.5
MHACGACPAGGESAWMESSRKLKPLAVAYRSVGRSLARMCLEREQEMDQVIHMRDAREKNDVRALDTNHLKIVSPRPQKT